MNYFMRFLLRSPTFFLALLFAAALTLTAMLSLSGCSMVRNIQASLLPALRELQLNATMPSEEQATDEMAQQIVAALDARDKEVLRSLFSEKALSEADDMDEGLDYIMETYKGTSKTYESGGSQIQDHYGSPGRTKTIFGFYNIETNYKSYMLYFEYQLIDASSPDAIGLTFVKLVDFDMWDRDEANRDSSSYGKVGIYNPGWDTAVQDDDE